MNTDERNMHKYFESIKDLIKIKSLKYKDFMQIENFHLNENECLFLLDYSRNEIIYKKGFQNVLGYQDDEITNDFIIDNIHPDDANIVSRIIRASVTYCIEYPKNSANNLLDIKHRQRKRDGTYIHVLNHSSVYDLDDEGRVSVALIRFTNISFLDNTKNVNWTFKAKNLNEKAFKEQINKAYKDFFTEREIEVISEINKGLTNKLIGKNLSISEHTVATHRKNIFKKSKCHNPKELMLFCNDKGII